MIRGGIRAVFFIAAVFVGVLAFALFISNSSLAPIGTGKITAFKVAASEAGDGDTGGGDSGAGGDAGSGESAGTSGTTGDSGSSTAPIEGESTDGADSPTRPGSEGNSDSTVDSGSGGGGGGGGGRRTSRSDDSATEGSGGDGSSRDSGTSSASEGGSSSRSSVPESFESEEEFVDAFVDVAQTTIARDYGLKQAEVREVIRNSNQEVSEVVLEGVSEGYFMGFIPVRSPKQLIVSHVDDQAYVRKISIPWWAWLVRFVET